MKNSPIRSLEYGATNHHIEQLQDDFESAHETNTLKTPNNHDNQKRRYSNTIIAVICVSLILIIGAVSQSNLRSNSLFIAFSQSKMPILSGDVAPPAKNIIPDSGKAPSNTIPVNTIVPVSSTRTFGLKRVGYSFIPLDNKPLVYTNLASHTTLIEPYADTELWMSSADDSMYYKYSLCNSDGSTCYSGHYSTAANYITKGINVACSPGDKFTLTYSSFRLDSQEKISSETGTAVCMYVRREIRALSTSDLSKTMDAMYALWSTNNDDGMTKYGSKFKSASYFVNLHHFNAAWQDAGTSNLISLSFLSMS
jgi:hypothetical protein